MKQLIIIFLLSFTVALTAIAQSTSSSKVKIAKLTRIMPDIISDPLNGKDTSVSYIFYLDHARLYKSSQVLIKTETSIKDDGSYEPKVIDTEMINQYFLYKDNEPVIRKYNAAIGDFSLSMTVDSFFKNEWIFEPIIDSIYSKSKMTLVANNFTNDDDNLFQKFEWQDKIGFTEKGTMDLIYSKSLYKFPYSMSSELNTTHQMKLAAATIRYTSGCVLQCFKDAGLDMHEFTISYQLQSDELSHHPDVIQLLAKNHLKL